MLRAVFWATWRNETRVLQAELISKSHVHHCSIAWDSAARVNVFPLRFRPGNCPLFPSGYSRFSDLRTTTVTINDSNPCADGWNRGETLAFASAYCLFSRPAFCAPDLRGDELLDPRNLASLKTRCAIPASHSRRKAECQTQP